MGEANIKLNKTKLRYKWGYSSLYQNYIKVSALCHCALHTFISLGANFIYIYYND